MKSLFALNICFVFSLSLLVCWGCENDLERVQELNPDAYTQKEMTTEVELIYSDSAVVRTIIRADRMYNYVDKHEPYQEFPEGIHVDFFDNLGRTNSVLTAKYAVRYEKKKQIIVRDSVVWKSAKPETLETEELVWNEKDGKVTSNRFVKITTPDDVIYGYGFEANEDFSHWKILAPQGTMKGDNLE